MQPGDRKSRSPRTLIYLGRRKTAALIGRTDKQTVYKSTAVAVLAADQLAKCIQFIPNRSEEKTEKEYA